MSEMQPPEGGHVPEVSPAPDDMPGATPPRPERKLRAGYFALGFFTPLVVGALTVGAVTLIGQLDTNGSLSALSTLVLQALSAAALVGVIAAFVVGRTKGDHRLRSFGAGGLTFYVVAALLSLLVFGACLVSLSGSSLFGTGK